ncbi:MAG: hypothetical protein AB8F65_11885 [Woeseiaceae bacterium]
MSYYRNTDRFAGLLALAGFLLFTFAGHAEAQVEPLVIPVSQPGKPVKLNMHMISARMRVIAEDRDDVAVEVSGGKNGRSIVTPSGPKSIGAASYNLSASEENNEVIVRTEWHNSAIDIVARVPFNASLDLRVTNDSWIVVENVRGAMELQNVNGPIEVIGAASSVIAESVNGDIQVSFSDMGNVESGALNTVNGDLVLGLPDGASAALHLDSSRGDIVTDFEVEVQPSKPIVARNAKGNRTEVKVANVIVAHVNGGGPVIRFKTLNGDIQINKVR